MHIHVAPAEAMDAHKAAAYAHQLLLAEYIHRSANDFAVACAEVTVAGRQPTLASTRDRLETLTDRLYSLASIQRLLQPPRADAVDLANQLGDLCHHHAQARFAEQGVFVQLRANDIEVDAERGWALLMIVSELLTNAARHAYVQPGGLVKVDIVRRGDEVICLVSDDGIGMPQAKPVGRAGTAIVAELARGAGIEFNSHPCQVGTTVELRMPIYAR
ncbi:sensor histidine kinase [Novosphingobium sp. AP12]|uniref:ATP-binding protein n=1 Tax=Novosphingobium sp. AP12 TaxID=1144305 RepID=UPI000271D96D|nr:sensor histidine kinase [Novosphingobium sp. AP12]EJL20402.1 signal transduction histidine kinase [Novosphingobium sp. AP12]